jgi:hypothetical protein
MKKILAVIMIAMLPLAAFAGRCSGGANCRACKNCSYCKHCAQQGGTCSVCHPEKYRHKKNTSTRKKNRS